MRVDLGNLTEITKKSAAVQNKGTQAVLNENITTKETDKTGHSYTVKSVTYETLLAEDKKSAEDIAMQADAVDPQAMHDEMAVLANTTTEEDYEKMEEDGTFEVLPKKEVIKLKKELDKLQKNLGGIKEMKKIPDAIFIVDPKKERICVQEAHSLGIPLIGIADTNCDPEELDYVIPGNDDAIRAVKLIVSKMADAVIEANQGTVDVDTEAAEDAEEAVEA